MPSSDPRAFAIKEALVVKVQLIGLMNRLDEGEICGIVYGLPDVPLAKQQVHQLIRLKRPHSPTHYSVRVMSQCVVRNESKFPNDLIGRQDAIDEFVERCAARKAQAVRHLSQYPFSTMGWESHQLALFVQKVLPLQRFVWAV